jgi:hypothetical protein
MEVSLVLDLQSTLVFLSKTIVEVGLPGTSESVIIHSGYASYVGEGNCSGYVHSNSFAILVRFIKLFP